MRRRTEALEAIVQVNRTEDSRDLNQEEVAARRRHHVVVQVEDLKL